MTFINSQHELINGISLFDIKSFLRSKGWKESTSLNRKLIAFQGPTNDSGSPLELFLPSSVNFKDISERIFDVFSLLSNLYEIEPSKLSDILKSLNRDKLLIAINPNDNFPFSIPLEIAKKEVNGIRNLLVYSACSEKIALPHHEKALAIGHKMADKIRFGHTFHGSFGFSIESPIAEEAKQVDLFSSPIERRIIERIIRGTKYTSEAVAKEDPGILVNNYKYGFNSRMCEAIVEMGESLEEPIRLAVQWASSLPPSEDIQNFRSIEFGENEFSYLSYAAEKLKEVKPKQTVISGMVIKLQSNDLTNEEGKRTIILKHYHEEHGSIDVKIDLGIKQYLLAIEAHKSRELLVVTGLLERKGTVWQLEAVSDLRVQQT